MYKTFKEQTPSATPAPTPTATPQVPEVILEDDLDKIYDTKKDIMISYSHQDKIIMNKLKNDMEAHGVSVWVDRQDLGSGDNFLDKIGEAIINCEVFVPILSRNSIKSKFCVGECALAYISDKPIFPVALEGKKALFPFMPTGMRLELAEFDWIQFCDNAEVTDEAFEAACSELVPKIKSILTSAGVPPTVDMPASKDSKLTMRTRESDIQENGTLESERSEMSFWETWFGTKEDVPWNEFENAFLEHFNNSEMFNEEEKMFVLTMLYKELKVQNNILKHDNFMNFGHESGPRISFSKRVKMFTVETMAVREVFDVNSKLRVDAINNLGKYKSSAVVEALLDLLEDEDANARAVALMSLAKTGQSADDVIDRIYDTLNDTDRLVREAACIALGRLKANRTDVVMKIVNIWRNDVIASVRECAELALHQMESEEARTAIHMTEILKKEIQMLKD